jgi:ABC-2 type transport system permease protein
VLLLSVFFSGFFLPVDRLMPAVRSVSWVLPMPYALDALRTVMFRGTGVDASRWLWPGGGSAGLMAASAVLTEMRRVA